MATLTVSDRVAAKAARYLTTGRVTITHADTATVTAEVVGGAPYRVSGTVRGWRCSCPAWKTCAHIVAVRHVAPPSLR